MARFIGPESNHFLALSVSKGYKIFEMAFRKFSQEDFIKKKCIIFLSCGKHRPHFVGNSHSTGISQLRAGKTQSKRPRSHCLSTMHLLPYMWASFYSLDPSRYLSLFLSWRLKTKKFPFLTNLCARTRLFLSACCGLTFDPTDLPNS